MPSAEEGVFVAKRKPRPGQHQHSADVGCSRRIDRDEFFPKLPSVNDVPEQHLHRTITRPASTAATIPAEDARRDRVSVGCNAQPATCRCHNAVGTLGVVTQV